MDWMGFITNIINRVPFERILVPPPDHTKALEDFRDSLKRTESQNPAPVSSEATIATQVPATASVEGEGTACIPCADDHLSTCSGLLSEAMRFARKDGIESSEVITRLGLCRDELNAMERVDLRPELTSTLPQWEKQIANLALNGSRDLRHDMAEMNSVDDLEKVAAKATRLRKEVSSRWMKGRLSQMSPEERKSVEERAKAIRAKLGQTGEQEMSLEEAKKAAAEQAQKEVEARWQSQEKR